MATNKEFNDVEEVLDFYKKLGFDKRAYRVGDCGIEGLIHCYWGFVETNYEEPNILVFKKYDCHPLNENNLSQCADYQTQESGVLKWLERKGLKALQPTDFESHKGTYYGKIPSWALDMVNSYEVPLNK